MGLYIASGKKIACHIHEKRNSETWQAAFVCAAGCGMISAVCVRLSFQHHGHCPHAVSYLFSCNLL